VWNVTPHNEHDLDPIALSALFVDVSSFSTDVSVGVVCSILLAVSMSLRCREERISFGRSYTTGCQSNFHFYEHRSINSTVQRTSSYLFFSLIHDAIYVNSLFQTGDLSTRREKFRTSISQGMRSQDRASNSLSNTVCSALLHFAQIL
jgi:hypothetical protein